MTVQVSIDSAQSEPVPGPRLDTRSGARQPSYVCNPDPMGLWMTLREVWDFRRLISIFVWRDLRVRYKHTLIGAAWNIVQPVSLMLVFTLVFGVLFTGRTGNIPYPIFLYPALLLWQFFGKALASGGTSLESVAGVINKIYFPKLIAPFSAIAGALIDLFVAGSALLVLMVLYGIWPTWRMVLMPFMILLATLFGLGSAIWLSALDAKYRDIRHTLPFLTQLWMFSTPVIYPITFVPERFQLLYSLNPMVGMVQGFRWSVTGQGGAPTAVMLGAAVFWSLLLLVSGMRYFNVRQGTLIDTV